MIDCGRTRVKGEPKAGMLVSGFGFVRRRALDLCIFGVLKNALTEVFADGLETAVTDLVLGP